MSEVGDGTGGYAGVTDWNRHDVPAMWRMLERQRTDAQWRQLAGWRGTAELAQAHLSRLRVYRDALATAWPPERSAAARAYLTRLDHLIDTVTRTAEVASANSAVLAATIGAIDTSRARLETIHQEYVEKRRLRETYDRQVAQLAAIGYHPWQPAPVTEAEVERLNTRARSVMFALSGDLARAQTQIRQPPTYNRPPSTDTANSDVYGTAGPPVIPSIVPVPTGTPVRSTATARRQPVDRRPVTAPAAPPGLGPVLGGVAPVPGPAGAGAAPGPVVPVAPPASSGLPELPPLPVTPPVGARPGVPPPAGPVAPGGGPLRPPNGEIAGPRRALPPGGVIGGMGPVAGGPVRQVNPVGGVLGNGVLGPASAAPAGRAATRPTTSAARALWTTPHDTIVQPGGGLSPTGWRDGGTTGGRAWDPDDPWRTGRGGPPVLLPPPEPGQADPGPAIGLDR